MASYTKGVIRHIMALNTAFARVVLMAGDYHYAIAFDVDNLFQRTNSRWRGPFGDKGSAIDGAEDEAEDMGVELTWIGPNGYKDEL